MGVVYKAQDTKLGRFVALKFLPETLVPDQQTLERFQREARTASALDHPHICTVYEIGEHEGRPFIAMQYLEGCTLKDRIGGKPLRTSEVVELGMQISGALDAADQKGIVHRDIKPANIFVTPQGAAMILDFGLAKLTAAGPAGLAYWNTAMPTVTLAADQLTRPGMVMGTVAYMSPEQARGEELDRRTDIFSFGAVLFEMTTGRPPFSGNTVAAIFGAILHQRPVAVRSLNPDLPARLEEIIQKVLEKDRQLRYQHAADIRADLQRLQRDMGEGRDTSVSMIIATATRPRKWRIALLAVVIPVLLIAVGYGIYWLQNRSRPVPFQNNAMNQVTANGSVILGAISPDGNFIASAEIRNGKYGLWLRNVATNSDTEIGLASPAGYGCLDFSPDGNYLYLCDATSVGAPSLFRVPVLGGTPQRIVRNIGSDITFSPDGKEIAYLRKNDPKPGEWRLLAADADGTAERILLSESGLNRPDDYEGIFSRQLSWSSDGSRIAVAVTGSGTSLGSIDLVDARNSRRETFLKIDDKLIRSLTWLSDGRGFLVNYATRAAPHHWLIGSISYPQGNFHSITNDTSSYFANQMPADGKILVAVQSRTTRQLYLLPSKGFQEGTPQPLPLRTQNVGTFSWDADGKLFLSADGKLTRIGTSGRDEATLLNFAGRAPAPCDRGSRFVFEWDYRGGAQTVQVWRADADGSNLVQLTKGVDGEDPVCSADGKWVYYVDAAKAQPMQIPIEGGQAEPVPGSAVRDGVYAHGNIALSPGGERLVYLAKVATPGTQGSLKAVIVKLDSGGSTAPQLIDVDQGIAYPPQFSPDGKSIAYPIEETSIGVRREDDLWLQPLDGSPRRRLTNFASGNTRVFYWSPDGKTLGVLRGRVDSDIVVLRESVSKPQ